MKELKKVEEDYKRLIRKYATCDLVEYFSKKSIESYMSDKKGVTFVDVSYYEKRSGAIGVFKDFMYGQWELIEICYHSIMYSNDYRTGNAIDDNAFYHIVNTNKRYSEEKEKLNLTQESLFVLLQCMSNVQFDFQHITVNTRFNRMYHILTEINLNSKFKQDESICYINFQEQFKVITGIEYQKFIKISLFLIMISCTRKNTNIYDIIDDLRFDTMKLGFTKEDIEKVIILLSRDYEFYKSCSNWNILRCYPIVKTSGNAPKYLISNIYSLLMSLPDIAYWIIRNYYKDSSSNDFVIYFGKCFEFYVQELLDYYKIKYEYITEVKDKKTPDWKIETERFIFLIEQKSALFPLEAKTVNEDQSVEKMEQYIERNIIKAFKQLDGFELETEKTVIRICLTFEKIYMEENLRRIIESKMNYKTEKSLMWIVNIDEFEILMQILNVDEVKFNRIIQEKIYLEKTESKDGRNFEKLLRSQKYIYAGKILKHFDDIVDKFLKALK